MAKKDTTRRSRHRRRTLRDRRIKARLAGHTITEKPSLPIPECTQRPHGGEIAHTGFGESGDLGPPVGQTTITKSASVRSVLKKRRRGKCDGCDRKQMVLTKIQSGQQVCQTCLREIRGPEWANLATLKQIESLRRNGHQVDDSLTKEEYARILATMYLEQKGIRVDQSASVESLLKLQYETAVSQWKMSVAGVNYNNPDGTSRQSEIAHCKVGEILMLRRELANPHDSHATAVYRLRGRQIGYLPRDCSVVLASYLDEGLPIAAVIRRFVASDTDHRNTYVDIVVLYASNTASETHLHVCIERIRAQLFRGEHPDISQR